MTAVSSITTEGGVWINQPPVHSLDGETLRFETALNSDFWQRTWYGFERHSGHAFGFWVENDFTVQVQVRADFSQLYDQAGLFIQDNETHWVKAGIEFNDDQPAIGSVVTREFSDWSTGVFPGDARQFLAARHAGKRGLKNSVLYRRRELAAVTALPVARSGAAVCRSNGLLA